MTGLMCVLVVQQTACVTVAPSTDVTPERPLVFDLCTANVLGFDRGEPGTKTFTEGATGVTYE